MKKVILSIIAGVATMSAIAKTTLEFESEIEFTNMWVEINDGEPNPHLIITTHINQGDPDEKMVVELRTDKKDCYGIGKIQVEGTGPWITWDLKLTKACKGAKVKVASYTMTAHNGKSVTRYFKPLGDKTI